MTPLGSRNFVSPSRCNVNYTYSYTFIQFKMDLAQHSSTGARRKEVHETSRRRATAIDVTRVWRNVHVTSLEDCELFVVARFLLFANGRLFGSQRIQHGHLLSVLFGENCASLRVAASFVA